MKYGIGFLRDRIFDFFDELCESTKGKNSVPQYMIPAFFMKRLPSEVICLMREFHLFELARCMVEEFSSGRSCENDFSWAPAAGVTERHAQ